MADDELPTLDVEVWADVVCPWCYVAEGRLRAAVAAYRAEHDSLPVTVRHRAFEFDPDLPRDRQVPFLAWLREQYGVSEADGRWMIRRVSEAAAQDGLALRLEEATASSTFDAHRLIAAAGVQGGEPLASALVRRLYAAYCEDGLVVADHAVLERMAVEVGLPGHVAAEVLRSSGFATQVRDDEERAARWAMSGVPFVVAGGRVSVTGAQPVEVYRRMLEQASAG